MIKILSCLIPIKFLREKFRLFCNSIQIIFTAKSIGKNFYCGKFSTVNKNTIIKNNVSLNGLHISGSGKVILGNYFRAGFDSLIISDNHNYKGTDLPYDRTIIPKDTEIGDFVWIGARVSFLQEAKLAKVLLFRQVQLFTEKFRRSQLQEVILQ